MDIEELVMAAAENPSPKALSALLNAVKSAGNPVPAEISQALNTLYEAMNEESLDPSQANFFLDLASLSVADTPTFRRLLAAAVKILLPPYLNHAPVMRALGLRETSVPVSHIVGRLKKLAAIKNGTILFLNSSSRWGSIGVIDNIAGTVTLNPFGASSASSAVPLELVLVSGVLLASGIDVVKIADNSGRTKMSSNDFRAIVKAKALCPVTESHLMAMAKAGLGAKMTQEDFDTWYQSTATAAPVATGKRRACNGRSLQEILLLLDGEGDEKFTDEEAAAFGKFFMVLKDDVIKHDLKRVGEVLVRISARASKEQLSGMVDSLKNRLPLWPKDPMKCDYNAIAVWSDLAAKDVEKLAKVTASVFPPEYLAACAMRLPQKAVNAFGMVTPVAILDQLLTVQRNYSADLALWIWKNRKKETAPLLKYLIIDNIIRALSQENLPKAWTAAVRELKMLLMDNAEFQKFLIQASGNANKLVAALQGALFLSGGERQSLTVKLSRYSTELRDQLESGAGAKILSAGTSNQEKQAAAAADKANEPHYTSPASHRRLLAELNDIVNVQKPENREALKVARAHGDFRENAEFDAAKERRNLLNKREHELEKELQRIQEVNLRDVKVSNVSVMGSEVVVSDSAGHSMSYYLLGAWDGNPAKNYLSYKTRLGEALLNRKSGDKVSIPGNKVMTVLSVNALPEAVLKDLD